MSLSRHFFFTKKSLKNIFSLSLSLSSFRPVLPLVFLLFLLLFFVPSSSFLIGRRSIETGGVYRPVRSLCARMSFFYADVDFIWFFLGESFIFYLEWNQEIEKGKRERRHPQSDFSYWSADPVSFFFNRSIFFKNRSPITGFSLDPFGWIRWSKRFFGCRKHPHPVLIGWPPTGQWRGVWLCFFFNLLVPKANWVVPFCLLLLLVLLRFKGFVGFNPYRNELESGFLEFNSEFYGIVLGLTGFDRV